jgi:hypothetical protein
VIDLRIAERSGDDFVLAFARMTLDHALVHRQTPAERDRIAEWQLDCVAEQRYQAVMAVIGDGWAVSQVAEKIGAKTTCAERLRARSAC